MPMHRRHLLLAAVAPAAGASAQVAPGRTPSELAGAFYPTDWSGEADADLVRVQGAAAQAQGQVIHLRGRILDARGQPVAGAMVELWQCDANGIYHHPRDRVAGRDPGFQGRGRMMAGPDGTYAFRTIRPVGYAGRTPHIHVAVASPSRERLVTQLYMADEPTNARDFLFRNLRNPEAVLLRPIPADRLEANALLAERDLII